MKRRNLGITMEDRVIREMDLLAGPTKRSEFIQEAVIEKLARSSARLSAVLQGARVEHSIQPGTDQGSGLLKNARVQHAQVRNPSTRKLFVGATMVFPSPKTAADVGDDAKGAPFSIFFRFASLQAQVRWIASSEGRPQ